MIMKCCSEFVLLLFMLRFTLGSNSQGTNSTKQSIRSAVTWSSHLAGRMTRRRLFAKFVACVHDSSTRLLSSIKLGTLNSQFYRQDYTPRVKCRYCAHSVRNRVVKDSLLFCSVQMQNTKCFWKYAFEILLSNTFELVLNIQNTFSPHVFQIQNRPTCGLMKVDQWQILGACLKIAYSREGCTLTPYMIHGFMTHTIQPPQVFHFDRFSELQPVLHSTPAWPTHTHTHMHTDHATCDMCSNKPHQCNARDVIVCNAAGLCLQSEKRKRCVTAGWRWCRVLSGEHEIHELRPKTSRFQ